MLTVSWIPLESVDRAYQALMRYSRSALVRSLVDLQLKTGLDAKAEICPLKERSPA
jgi:hypothetical protein